MGLMIGQWCASWQLDKNRIGLWGTSFSGGHTLVAASKVWYGQGRRGGRAGRHGHWTGGCEDAGWRLTDEAPHGLQWAPPSLIWPLACACACRRQRPVCCVVSQAPFLKSMNPVHELGREAAGQGGGGGRGLLGTARIIAAGATDQVRCAMGMSPAYVKIASGNRDELALMLMSQEEYDIYEVRWTWRRGQHYLL